MAMEFNDTGGIKQASHLLKYDSTLGIFKADVKPADNGISVDGKVSKVVSDRNPINLPWKDLGVDLVIEGTRVFMDRDGAGKHFQVGAKKFLICDYTVNEIPSRSENYLIITKCEVVSPALEMEIKDEIVNQQL